MRISDKLARIQHICPIEQPFRTPRPVTNTRITKPRRTRRRLYRIVVIMIKTDIKNQSPHRNNRSTEILPEVVYRLSQAIVVDYHLTMCIGSSVTHNQKTSNTAAYGRLNPV